jgi:transposase-like protein
MALHVYVFLLVVCLFLLLARLGRLDWFALRPSSSPGGAKRSRFPRQLVPRTPDDCPASTASSAGVPAPVPVRPWREVKSRRGAPTRINTEGFACPNPQCQYCGNTDAHLHALVGDGKHGRAEPIQTFRCQKCRTTISARRDTPLYRLKTPSQQVAVVLSALAEGLDPSAASRVFGYRQATITTWLTRAGGHAQTMHERFFRNLQLPHLLLRRNSHTAAQLHSGASFCGWLSIRAPRFCPCLSLAPAPKPSPTGSSTPCDRYWLLDVFRSLPVTGSISISLRSRLTLVSG